MISRCYEISNTVLPRLCKVFWDEITEIYIIENRNKRNTRNTHIRILRVIFLFSLLKLEIIENM